MVKELIQFNGKKYAFNMDKIINFVSNLTNNEKSIETSITHTYANVNIPQDGEKNPDASLFPNYDIMKNGPITKEIRESKSNCNDNFNGIRYDLAKTLIGILIEPLYDRNGDLIIQDKTDSLTLGQTLCFNTLAINNIIYEINDAKE